MNLLKLDHSVQYDEKDAIGRRYRRQDAIGTPLCITIDHDTLEDNAVTLRDRDTMEQVRVPTLRAARPGGRARGLVHAVFLNPLSIHPPHGDHPLRRHGLSRPDLRGRSRLDPR